MTRAELKRAWEDWTEEHSDVLTHAVTFTMQQTVNHGLSPNANDGYVFEKISPLSASKNLRLFISLLNRDIYGSAWDKHGKGIYIFSTIEGITSDKHIHIHSAVGFPDRRLSDAEIDYKVKHFWKKTTFGKSQSEIVVKSMHNKIGWLNYIQKEMNSTGDYIQIETLSLPKSDKRS